MSTATTRSAGPSRGGTGETLGSEITSSASVPAFTEIRGGSAGVLSLTTNGFRTVPNPNVTGTGVIVMLQAIATLTAGDKAKYVSRIMESLEPQFKLLSPVEGKMAFEQVYSLEAHLLTLENHLCLTLMLDVFDIRRDINATGNITGNRNPTSLFGN